MTWRPENWDKIKEDVTTRIGGSWNQDTHRQLFQAGADAMLEAICEEIEKGLLTNEERMAVNIPCEECDSARHKPYGCFPDFATAGCLDCVAKYHEQTQLQKILSLFK